MKFLNDIVLTGAGADLTAPATVTFSGLSTTTETNAVVVNSSGVLSKRGLGSNAFNSTTIPTGNAIIDWTQSGAGTIHADNYIENVVQTAVTGRATGTEDWVNSRGENLFSNGSSLLGNIVNMPGFTFDGTHANNSPGSFKWTGTGTPFTGEFIPVDASRKYKMQYDAKTENGVGRYYGFTGCFDVDGISIQASNHMYRANTLTTLAVTLVNGATTITLASSANWNNAGTAGSSNHLRSLIIWNYTNSFGYTYPEETYSRNYTSQAWQPGGINFSSHVITLRVPWAGGTIASGTKVSNGSSGGTFKYNVMANKVLTTDWVRQSGYMDGVDYSGTNVSTKFPPGTAKIKLGWLMNYQNAQQGEVAWFTNISVGVAAHEDNEIAEAIERATDSNKFTDSDHTKLNGIETSATADQSNAEIRAAVAAATDSQVFTDADHTKLDNIAANATVDQVLTFKNTSSANASVGAGWMTVAKNDSHRHHGEVMVSDGDSSDHSFVRIDWMRSYADTNFSVLNVGGHANRITGIRVLQESSDVTYGVKLLQVYVTANSNYGVRVNTVGVPYGYTIHTVVTPVIENTKSGYAVQHAALTNLQDASLATQQGITVGGNITVLGTVDGIDIATDVAANTLKTSNVVQTSVSGNAGTATALTSGNKSIGGTLTVTSSSDGILNLRQSDAGSTAGTKEGGWNYIQFQDGQGDRQAYFGIDSNGNLLFNPEVEDALVKTNTGLYVGGNITLSGTVDGRDIAADGTKLNTIATNATANSSDATLKSRANHTGTQAYSTITGTPTIPSGNQIIDWTSDQGSTNIHAGNYTDTNTTYTTATSSTLGLVKIGYTESGKNYPVELSSGKMYVNVPWTNTQNDNEEDAAEGTKGVVELATNAEVVEGTNSDKATTPRGVKGAIDGIAVPIAGNKTISGVKTFSSTIVGSVNGNSATTSERTITSGEISAISTNTSKVGITTGSQTIAGSKTFSSPIKGQVVGIASNSSYINKTAAQFAADGTDKVYIGSNNYGWNDARDYATNFIDVDAPVLNQNDAHNGIICPVNLSQVSIMSQVRMNAADGAMQVRVYKMARPTGVNTSNLALTQIATASVSTVNGRMTTLDATGSTAVSAGDLIIVGFGKTSGGNGQKPRINFTLTGTTV